MWRSMYAPLARPMRNAAAVALGATVLSSAAARDHVGSVALPVARAEGVGGSGGRPRDSSSMEDADGFFSHIENCRKRACSDPDATRSALLQALRSRKPPGAQGSAAGAADGGAHGGAGAAPSAGPVDGGDGEVEDGATDDDIAPDAQQLGRATWTLLHAMADSYPERPSAETQADATRFFHFLSRRYPCGTCAADFRAEIAKDPPAVESRRELVGWLCRQHNIVNAKLGKPQFDCSWPSLLRRWGSDLDEVEAAQGSPTASDASPRSK